MIKLTFEGEHILEVRGAIVKFLRESRDTVLEEVPKGAKPPEEAAPPKEPVASKPKGRPPAAKAPKAEAPEPEPPQPSLDDLVLEPPPEDPEPELDPVQLTAIRVKTTEDLQAAYSSGKHKQVLGLLAKYGNGAKSFRELQIKDFVPIRKAIDAGALA